MNNISMTGLIINMCLKAPFLSSTHTSFTIKNTQLTKFSSSFLFSSKPINVVNSRFAIFFESPFILSSVRQYKIHNKKKFSISYSSQNDNFTKCIFVQIRAHAIFCYDISGYLSLVDCHFENCSTNDPEPDTTSSSGGAVYSINSDTVIFSTTFIGCYSQGYGHAFSLECASLALCSSSNIYYCHPFQINYANSAHMVSQNSIFEYSNITMSESQSNSGLFLNGKSIGRVFCININNVTGASILSISSTQAAEYGNIVSCDANSGIIHSELKDIVLSKFFFNQNVGPLDSHESKFIISFVDCIFKDHNKTPKGKHIAIQGTYALNDDLHTNYIFPKQKHISAAKHDKKHFRMLGIFLLILTISLGSLFLYVKLIPIYLNVKKGIEEEKRIEYESKSNSNNSDQHSFSNNIINRFQYN